MQTAENVDGEHREPIRTYEKGDGQKYQPILHGDQQHERGCEDRHQDARQSEQSISINQRDYYILDSGFRVANLINASGVTPFSSNSFAALVRHSESPGT